MKSIFKYLDTNYHFIKRHQDLSKSFNILRDYLSDEEVISNFDLSAEKRLIHLINYLYFSSENKDSLLVSDNFTKSDFIDYLSGKSTVENFGLVDVSDYELRNKSMNFIDFKNVDFSDIESMKEDNEDKIENHTSNHIKVKNKIGVTADTSEVYDDNYWIQSVSLGFPKIPKVDFNNIFEKEIIDGTEYCVYGDCESVPKTQSMISAVTNIYNFSDEDILNLFPKIRLYTRSPYMYQKYEGLEYDEDLGVIFPIADYSLDEIRTNIIEYPHLENIERLVKKNGYEVTIPFWKYIELDGEMEKTSVIWGSLKDTKLLPCTASFMNEYVVRKYILDISHGVKYHYNMFGTLEKFLTLYMPAASYEILGYDPLVIGKQCIQSRISYRRSRNPVLRKIYEYRNKKD